MILVADFLHLRIADVVDIFLVGMIIYLLIRWIRGSNAGSILMAIISLYFIWIVVDALKLKLTSAIMGRVLDVGALALIVIFQPEVRRFLLSVGNRYRFTQNNSFLSRLFSQKNAQATFLSLDSVNEICKAVQEMGQSCTGALIVIRRSSPLDDVVSTGDRIDAAISKRLVMNLFFKNSPLHDGAVVIDANRIVAARCTLPNTSKTDLPAQWGMRHKAALGICEQSDVDVIVVSEETGGISFVHGETLTRIDNINNLKQLLIDHK